MESLDSDVLVLVTHGESDNCQAADSAMATHILNWHQEDAAVAFLCSEFTGLFLPWLPDVLGMCRQCWSCRQDRSSLGGGLSAQCH